MNPMISPHKTRRIPRLMLAAILLGIILRLLFPLADPPLNLTVSGAPVGDPGQHSYGARNQVLFGQWSFDEWRPQMSSPLVSMALNWVTYRLLGVNFAAHKTLPILFALLGLAAFALLVHRRLPPGAAAAAMIFAAASYPLVMYARTANRYMPMLFFFLLAVHFFVRGGEHGRPRDFLYAAVMFLLAYASQNHILYMLGFFAPLSLFWLLSRRVHWKGLAAFWSMTIAGLGAWYVGIYLPNRDFFAHFVGHNSLVRRIYGLPQLLNNVLTNPFALQFRSDAITLLLGVLGVTAVAALWVRRRTVPPVVEAAAFWLILSAGFHSIWGYRPTRFYMVPLLAAALAAGWVLDRLVRRRRSPSAMQWAAGGLALAAGLLVTGVLTYGRYLLRRGGGEATLWLLPAVAVLLLVTGTSPARWRRAAAAALVILSTAVNLVYFVHWAERREYRITETAAVLARALPPTEIAGNWASILSIGTPHRTHLLSGEMGINWRRNFLKQRGVRYLLLTRARFNDEYREYMRLFSRDLQTARLRARFPVYNAEVQLWELSPLTDRRPGAEVESLTRRPARVVYDAAASGKMALSPGPATGCDLEWTPGESWPAESGVDLRARGRFRIHLRLLDDRHVWRRNLVIWNSEEYVHRTLLPGPLPPGARLEIRVSDADPHTRLDRLSPAPSH